MKEDKREKKKKKRRREIEKERERIVHTHNIRIWVCAGLIVNIVYPPYFFSFASKWVFTLGLLTEMRSDNLVSVHFYNYCQAQKLQWDATFDLLSLFDFTSFVTVTMR